MSQDFRIALFEGKTESYVSFSVRKKKKKRINFCILTLGNYT